MQPVISNNPEYILLHCGTNHLWQDIRTVEIAKTMIEVLVFCKSDKSNILVPPIVPLRNKLNAIAIQLNIQIFTYKMNIIKKIKVKKIKNEKLNY